MRAAICLVAAWCVFDFGSTERGARGILQFAAAVIFLGWLVAALRQQELEIRWNWLYLPMIGLLTIGAAQYFFRASAYAYATRVDWLSWGAILLLFFAACQAFASATRAESLVWFLSILAFAVSLLGIVQHFAPNGKLLWIAVLQQGGNPFGPYANRDHFAGFIELAAIPGLALLLFGAVRRHRLLLALVLAIVPAGAMALAASRAGVSIFLLQIFLLWIAAWDRNSRRPRRIEVGLLFAAGALIAWLGLGPIVGRLREASAQPAGQDGRWTIDRDTWRMFLAHPWYGTGLGTFRATFPAYQTFYSPAIVNHAHNDYLELLAETGLAGGLCGIALLAALLFSALHGMRGQDRWVRAIRCGTLVACGGLLVHGLADFNFHIPANALLFFLLAAVSNCRARPGPSAQSLEAPAATVNSFAPSGSGAPASL